MLWLIGNDRNKLQKRDFFVLSMPELNRIVSALMKFKKSLVLRHWFAEVPEWSRDSFVSVIH